MSKVIKQFDLVDDAEAIVETIPANTNHLYNICATPAQVFNAGPTLYKFYTNVCVCWDIKEM